MSSDDPAAAAAVLTESEFDAQQEYKSSFTTSAMPEYLMQTDEFTRNRSLQNVTDRFYIYVNSAINKLITNGMLTFNDKRRMKIIIDDKLSNVRYLNPWAFALAYYCVVNNNNNGGIDQERLRIATDFISTESLDAVLNNVDIVRYCRMLMRVK